MIVDDEKIIREGIHGAISWEAYDCTVCAMAVNGLEAYDLIMREQPDIVITDLKMPGMNGIELITKVKEDYPDIQFIILSGYGEFDYAKQAMKYGIKHYLLKPCDENELITYLNSILDDLRDKENNQKYLENVKSGMKKILPQVKEQFLRDFILGANYTEAELIYFMNLFEITETNFRLISLKTDSECSLTDKFALRNMVYDVIRKDRVYLSTIIANEVILVTEVIDLNELTDTLFEVKNIFDKIFKLNFCVGISNENRIKNLREMYLEVQECLEREFYLTENIVDDKIFAIKAPQNMFDAEFYNTIANSVKAGNKEELKSQLNVFFEAINSQKFEIQLAKTHCLELFINIIRQGDEIGNYYKYIWKIGSMDTLIQIYNMILSTAESIAERNYELHTQKHNMIIDNVIDCIQKNKDNPKLSLNWVAREVFFMNENYLGKLFLKETGEKFSQYVMKIRMEKAKELIENNQNFKIFEVTKMVGFEDNTQYFSQVFKKYSGYTPSEYKESIRHS